MVSPHQCISPDQRRHSGHRMAVVLLTGFTQLAKTDTGLFALATRLRHLFPWRDEVPLIRLDTWNGRRGWSLGVNQEENANQIMAAKPDAIALVGYSYGAGAGLLGYGPGMGLVEALRRRGRHVDYLALIDPVPRFRPWWASSTLEIPDCVRRVDAWRQTKDVPAGRVPVHPRQQAAIYRPFPAHGHADMDDMAEIHCQICNQCEQLHRTGFADLDPSPRLIRWG